MSVLSRISQPCLSRSPHAILDNSQRVVAVLVGMAKGEFRKNVVEKVTAAFKQESEALPPPGIGYMRGKFHAVLSGISHGGGTPVECYSTTVEVSADMASGTYANSDRDDIQRYCREAEG